MKSKRAKQQLAIRAIQALVIILLGVLTARLGWSGPLVFGPKVFTVMSRASQREVVRFKAGDTGLDFWLQVDNGRGILKPDAEPGVVDVVDRVAAGRIWLNGRLIATPEDFNHERTGKFGFTKDVTLDSVNSLEVETRGEPGSFVTIQIREAEPNVNTANSEGDLTGLNMGDRVSLWWSIDDGVATYVVYRATSTDGAWKELFKMSGSAARTSGAKTDVTPDAGAMDLCYRVEGLNAAGNLIRRYEPMCVPKYVARNTRPR